ncbi:hypothetical protein EDD86DRAFT_210261 [Gorgonomyces haynaldii]|nr:hypothetical protein EDD86DRAFT_210261 [Gorgonomyces haynaldii]
MLCTATVLMRVADLVVPPAGLDSAMDNRLKLIFVVAGFRILFPLFVIWGGVEPSLFGQFVAWMLAADIFVFVFASVLVNAHLKRVQRVDPISHLSRTVLYSNSITTQVLAVFALFFSLVIGLISPQKSQINQIALDIFPSIYHLVLGFMLTFFYWDVKQLIQNPEAGRNKGLRRVKFSMSSILQ